MMILMTFRYFRIYYRCIHIFKLLFLKADLFTVDCIYMCERLRNNLKEHKVSAKFLKVLIDFYLLFHLLFLIESYFLVLTKKGNKIRTFSQQTVKFPIGAKYYTYALHLDSFCTCLICCTCIIKFENKSIDKNSL